MPGALSLAAFAVALVAENQVSAVRLSFETRKPLLPELAPEPLCNPRSRNADPAELDGLGGIPAMFEAFGYTNRPARPPAGLMNSRAASSLAQVVEERGTEGDPEVTLGFEVEFSSSNVRVKWSNLSQVWDHAPLFRTEHVQFQLETQSAAIETATAGIVEAVSSPFGVDKDSLTALYKGIGHVEEFLSNVNAVLAQVAPKKNNPEATRWTSVELGRVTSFATVADDVGSVFLKLGKSLQHCAAVMHPQVTVTYALENVHDVFAQGYMPKECGVRSHVRSAKMVDAAAKATTATELILNPADRDLPLSSEDTFATKWISGEGGNYSHPNGLKVSHREERRLRSFFTMLIQNARHVLEMNIPLGTGGSQPPCVAMVRGKCLSRANGGRFTKDLFGLISKTPLQLVFNSLQLNTKQQVYAYIEDVKKVLFTEFKGDYDALRQLWKDEGVAEQKPFQDTSESWKIGRFPLDPDNLKQMNLEFYIDAIITDGGRTLRERMSDALEHYRFPDTVDTDVQNVKRLALRKWARMIGDGTATPIIYRPQGSGIRPAFEYRSLKNSAACLKTVVGRVLGHANGTRDDGR